MEQFVRHCLGDLRQNFLSLAHFWFRKSDPNCVLYIELVQVFKESRMFSILVYE